MRAKLLLVAFIVACGGTQSPDTPGPKAEPLTPEAVVLAGKGAAEQYRQAYEVRSLEALAPIYSHGLDVIVVHQGKSYQGWTAVEKHLGELIEKSAEIHVRLTDVEVTSLGPEGAAVTAGITREVSDGVTKIVEEGMLTLALRLEGDRWLIVSEHFSYPTSAP
jgi:hypothetical protein